MNDLITAIRRWTSHQDVNVYAAVELLIGHGYWLNNQDFIDRCTYDDDQCTTINWVGLSGMLNNREFAGTVANMAVLRTAILLARDTFGLYSLDNYTRDLVVVAFADTLAPR